MKKVPNFKEPGLSQFLQQMMEERDRLAASKLSSVTANHSVLLQSSGGKVYEVTVTDAGVLTMTLVAG